MQIAAIDAIVIDRDTYRFIKTFLRHAEDWVASRHDRDAVLERLRLALVATVDVRPEDRRNAWRRVYVEVCRIAGAAPPSVASAESFEYVWAFLRENVDLLGTGRA